LKGRREYREGGYDRRLTSIKQEKAFVSKETVVLYHQASDALKAEHSSQSLLSSYLLNSQSVIKVLMRSFLLFYLYQAANPF